jgi:hypothetical protein
MSNSVVEDDGIEENSWQEHSFIVEWKSFSSSICSRNSMRVDDQLFVHIKLGGKTDQGTLNRGSVG